MMLLSLRPLARFEIQMARSFATAASPGGRSVKASLTSAVMLEDKGDLMRLPAAGFPPKTDRDFPYWLEVDPDKREKMTLDRHRYEYEIYVKRREWVLKLDAYEARWCRDRTFQGRSYSDEWMGASWDRGFSKQSLKRDETALPRFVEDDGKFLVRPPACPTLPRVRETTTYYPFLRQWSKTPEAPPAWTPEWHVARALAEREYESRLYSKFAEPEVVEAVKERFKEDLKAWEAALTVQQRRYLKEESLRKRPDWASYFDYKEGLLPQYFESVEGKVVATSAGAGGTEGVSKLLL